VLVLGNYVPGLKFLSMLLGSEPVLEPPAQFYQRMLSMESEDMLDLAMKHIEEHSLQDFYEEVFVPALLLSEEDRHSGALPESRQRFIFQASRELIDELERQDELARLEALGADPQEHTEPATMPALPLVLGLPARDEADEVVAYMLAHLLRRRGITAAVTPLSVPLEDAFKTADQTEVRMTFLSALPPSAVGAARQMCRRLKTRSPETPVLVGVWSNRASIEEIEKRLHASQPDEVVTTLGDAVERIETMVAESRTQPRTPAQSPRRPQNPSDVAAGSAPPFAKSS
jgi:hypothetical protein